MEDGEIAFQAQCMVNSQPLKELTGIEFSNAGTLESKGH